MEHKAGVEFSQITKQIFVGTNLCCTKYSHIKTLMDHGIDAEIDLEEERQESPPKVKIYLWLPVKDHHAPSQDQLDAGVAMLNASVNNNRKIYVHCRLGHGRSPTLVAAYFIYKGMEIDEAINKIKEKRPEIHLEDVQRSCLKDYKNKLRSDN